MRKLVTAMGLAAAVGVGPAAAQAVWTFQDIDRDGDLEVTEREFETASRAAFERLDRNRDDVLGEEEVAMARERYGIREGALEDRDEVDWEAFHAALFAVYDRDDDEAIAEREYADAGGIRRSAGMAGGGARAAATQMPEADVVSLSEWRYEDLYADAYSADEFIDEFEVYGANGEEIGDVEDILVDTSGRIVAVIAEVGGFWDIGDTHVSVPWNEVERRVGTMGIVVPVREENVEEYGVFDNEVIRRSEAAETLVAGADDAIAGNRLWRISELIGDYARIREADAYANYGYVSDVLLRDDRIAAVVVQPDVGYGVTGYRAYPWYGWGAGWRPGSPYYDMPYDREEVVGMDAFDREEMSVE